MSHAQYGVDNELRKETIDGPPEDRLANRLSGAAAGTSQSNGDENRHLEELLTGLMSTAGVEHAVLAVESIDGSFSWAGARGMAQPGGPAMTPQTPYYIASIDKLYTAVLLLLLEEQGLVDIEAPISTYLPSSLVTGIHRLDGRDRSGEITVRNLLAHTSGLANFLEDKPRKGPRLVDTLASGGSDRSWSIAEVVAIVRDDLRPHFAPQPAGADRSRVRYSDTNYQLLHAIIEAVTEKPLHEAFESRLFGPLGLDQTWMLGGREPSPDTPEPATLWAGEKPLEIPLALQSLAAIYSTVSDQIRFMRALVRGRIFERPETYRRMGEYWNRFGLPLDRAALRAPSWPIEYGLGIKRFRLPRLLTGFKPIPTVYGHSGSTGTWLFHCPELDLLIAGAVDQVTAGAVPYRFLPRLVGKLAQRPTR